MSKRSVAIYTTGYGVGVNDVMVSIRFYQDRRNNAPADIGSFVLPGSVAECLRDELIEAVKEFKGRQKALHEKYETGMEAG